MQAGEASERPEDAARAGSNRSYVTASVLVALVVTILFVWQPWNSNGEGAVRLVRGAAAAGPGR